MIKKILCLAKKSGGAQKGENLLQNGLQHF